MEMVAAEPIGVGSDLTPPLSPIAYSLHDSFISTHCSSCFNPLLHLQHTNTNNNNNNNQQLLYCSSSCSSSHSPIHISSAAPFLSPNPCNLEQSHLRTALILLLQFKHCTSYDRICGLMSNRHNLLTDYNNDDDDDDFRTGIRNGARAMAAAISIRNGVSDSREVFLLEEAMLCVVLTNSVEVQDKTGRSVGIAIYDTSFSWINHSCSPNACYRFLSPEIQIGQQPCLITPASSDCSDYSHLLTASNGGPKIVVRSIKMINKDEEITIAYTDLLQPKELRQLELWSKYRFTCCCRRCVAVPLTIVDQRLQQICGCNESFSECIDDAIHNYLSSNYNNAESCCKKLEDALLKGLHYKVRLHPQNHLSLNCYTTLASAYSTLSATANADENGLKMKRYSVAYAFLLALLTHDLYLSEPSLIVSVSNFWVGAGESLINFARCLLFCSNRESYSRCECCSIDISEGNYEVLEVSKKQVLKCIRDVVEKLWKFFVVGNGYLQVVKDPMDIRWFEDLHLKKVADNDYGWCECDCVEMGKEVLGLGVHCLLYGGILSNICGGRDSYLSCNVQRLLCEL